MNFQLQWVGLTTFLMETYDADTISEPENMRFLAFYLAANVVLAIFHWFVSAEIKNWILNAPFPLKLYDSEYLEDQLDDKFPNELSVKVEDRDDYF